MSKTNINNEISALVERISLLENRISIIENKLVSTEQLKGVTVEKEEEIREEVDFSLPDTFKSSLLEANIGEYGLAWFGNIVLLFGGIFLHLFIQSKGQALLAAVIGYIFAASMILIAKRINKSYSYLSSVFGLFGKLFLFYVTIELHFFGTDPFIKNKYIGLGLLLIPIIYQVYKSIKLKSEGHSQLALFYLIITAVLSNETHIFLPLITMSAVGSVYLLFRFGWTKTLIFSLILVYFSFLIWVLGNPFVNHPSIAVSTNQFSELYLFACAAIFSIVLLVKQKGLFRDSTIFSALILNGLGFSILLTLWSFLFFEDNYQVLFASISVFCILYSIILKKRSPWRYSPALYAVYGFVAISITFYGILKLPMIFLVLSLQSLLVLSMSLWFRSKIIVVMNTIMFIILIFIYFGYSEPLNIINFSFPVVAGISARIINWQRQRLTIETQFIRNIYLFILFFSMLYAFDKALPKDYVTLSWSIIALVYFGLSIVLRKVKYRYLAIATLGAASLHLFFVDLDTINVIYRIIAFLVLAIISIGISVYYVEKSRHKNSEAEIEKENKSL